MTIARRVAKNTIFVAFANLVSQLFALILAIFIARYLGVVEYGKYAFAFAFTSMFSMIFDLGLTPLTIREVARDKLTAGRYIGNLICIRILISILVLSLIFVLIDLMGYPHDTKLLVYILGSYFMVSNLAFIFSNITIAFERMEYHAFFVLVEKIIIVFFGVIIIFLGFGLVEVVSVFLLASIVVLPLSAFIVVRKFARPDFKISIKFWKFLIKNALPMGLTAIFVTIYFRIDTVMLSMMKGDAATGWYNAGYRFLEALRYVPGAFIAAAFPVYSRLFKSSQDSLVIAYEKSIKYMIILAVPIAFGTTILADRIILLIFGEEFINSIIALQILIWAVLFVFLNMTLGNILNAMNRQAIFTKVTGIGAVLNVSLNLILIPQLSYVGASIATVATAGMVFLLLFYFVSKHLYKFPLQRFMLKPIIASSVMGGAVYFLRDINLLVVISIGVVVYVVMIYLLGIFTRDDIKLAKEIIG